MSPITRLLGTVTLALAIFSTLPVNSEAQLAVQSEMTWPVWEPSWEGSPLEAHSNDDPSDMRERAIAGLWSAYLPGAGQFYRGERAKGIAMLTGFAASITYAVVAGIGEGDVCAGPPHNQVCSSMPHTVNRSFFIGMGWATGFYAWSLLDALSARH